MSKEITHALLKRLGACENESNKFRELFPNGTEVTVELCVKHAADFSWDWAVDNLMSSKGRAAFNRDIAPISAAFDRDMAPINAAYDRDRALIRAAFNRDMATSFATAFATETE